MSEFGGGKFELKSGNSLLLTINELLKNYSIKLERSYKKGKAKVIENRIYQLVKLNCIDEIVYNLVQSKRLTLTEQSVYIEPTVKKFSALVDHTKIQEVETKVNNITELDEPEVIEAKVETSNPQPAVYVKWVERAVESKPIIKSKDVVKNKKFDKLVRIV